MPKRYDDDKPQKSWREIDRAKDGSAHRKPTGGGMNPSKQARADSASKAYKSKLDSFFDGDGIAPEHAKEKLSKIQDTSDTGKARAKAIKNIKEAKTSTALNKAFAAFLKKWELPTDYEILSQALNCSDETYIEQSLDLLDAMFDDNRIPKQMQLLEQRLRKVKTLADDPDLQDKADALIKKLRLFK